MHEHGWVLMFAFAWAAIGFGIAALTGIVTSKRDYRSQAAEDLELLQAVERAHIARQARRDAFKGEL